MHSSVDRHGIENIIVGLLAEVRQRSGMEASIGTGLYGDGGLDSMSLVVLLAELEARIAEAYGYDIVLASERAMSRRHSPFMSVDALTEFVMELLAEKGASCPR